MGIFDRLGRIARSEVSELKRVLREARDDGLPDPLAEEAERDRLIAEAEAELARAEQDVLASEIDAGAALWGGGGAVGSAYTRDGREPVAPGPAYTRDGREPVAPGSAYTRDGREPVAPGPAYTRDGREPVAPGPAPVATDADVARGADLWARAGRGEPPAPRAESATPRAEPRPGRAHAFPRDVRAAYAALELPLGAPRDEIEASYRRLVARYHPDRHAQSAHLQSVATELTVRIREARDLLLSWLGEG